MRHLVERETHELSDAELLDVYDGAAGTDQREELRGELQRRMSRRAHPQQFQQGLAGMGLGLGQQTLGGQGNG